MGFIDTHCHILPGVDDGSPDDSTSVEMARIAAGDDISTIVTTPHIVEGIYDGRDRQQRLHRLQGLLAEYNVSIKLISGAEVPMSICISGNDEYLKELAIGGGKYLLMETAETTSEQLAQAVYKVRLAGLCPILAHPERTALARHHPDQLAQMIQRNGAYMQVTAASIEGLFGKTVQKTWKKLACSGLVHLIATDAHSRRARAPRLSASFEAIRQLAGEEAAHIIMMENPQRVLSGDKLLSVEPAPHRHLKQSLWSKLRKRTI